MWQVYPQTKSLLANIILLFDLGRAGFGLWEFSE